MITPDHDTSARTGSAFADEVGSNQWGTILALNFDKPEPIRAHTEPRSGTIDQPGRGEGSGALVLKVSEAEQFGNWTSTLDVGPLPIDNDETKLGKLTIAVSILVSLAAPVSVIVTAYDSDRRPLGQLRKTLLPAASNYFQRYTIELDSMSPNATTQFDPTSPFVGFAFEIGSALGWPSSLTHRLRIDNLHYARPAYYVSPDGDDRSAGRHEERPLRTPQKALDLAAPGDIVVLSEGVYSGDGSGTPVISPSRSGEPHKWITVKNLSGHRPIVSASGQSGLEIRPDAATGDLAYLEFRGLDIRGNAATARTDHGPLIGTDHPLVDSRGVTIVGDGFEGPIAHHIRIADCRVRNCTSDGIFVDYADWIAIEGNDIADNCRTTIGFAPSGIAVMHYANFDLLEDTPKFLIASNRVHGNRLTVHNHPFGEQSRHGYYNGNGILLDANAMDETESYLGRTLVQNNVVYENGGGGIQCWGSHRLDIAHNTITMNGQTPELKWGQLGLEFTRRSSIINNIITGQPDVSLDTWFSSRPNLGAAAINRVGNVYFGGSKAPELRTGDVAADPAFAEATGDNSANDLNLTPHSPGGNIGVWLPSVPAGDIGGRVRPRTSPPTAGAFQLGPADAPQPLVGRESAPDNRRRDGQEFDPATVETVWEKGDPHPSHIGRRADACGAQMIRDKYAEPEPGGWVVDHIYPLSQGGTDNLANLVPVRWENSRHRNGDYPEFTCVVVE